jgi:hypothetical protein
MEVFGPNMSKEPGMASKADARATVIDQENLIEGVAKYFLEKVYGSDGMPWGTRFADLEELSVQIGQAMSRSMIDQALARQALSVPSEVEICSGCGGSVERVDDTEPRVVLTRVGTAQWDEPKRYCSKCRAAFFPSSPSIGN